MKLPSKYFIFIREITAKKCNCLYLTNLYIAIHITKTLHDVSNDKVICISITSCENHVRLFI